MIINIIIYIIFNFNCFFFNLINNLYSKIDKCVRLKILSFMEVRAQPPTTSNIFNYISSTDGVKFFYRCYKICIFIIFINLTIYHFFFFFNN